MKKNIFTFLSVLVLCMLVVPSFAGAQTFVTGISGVTGVTSVLDKVANWFLTIVIALSVIFFVYAGFLYVTGAGSEEAIGNAKKFLLYGILGIVIAVLAKAIAAVVQSLLSEV